MFLATLVKPQVGSRHEQEKSFSFLGPCDLNKTFGIYLQMIETIHMISDHFEFDAESKQILVVLAKNGIHFHVLITKLPNNLQAKSKIWFNFDSRVSPTPLKMTDHVLASERLFYSGRNLAKVATHRSLGIILRSRKDAQNIEKIQNLIFQKEFKLGYTGLRGKRQFILRLGEVRVRLCKFRQVTIVQKFVCFQCLFCFWGKHLRELTRAFKDPLLSRQSKLDSFLSNWKQVWDTDLYPETNKTRNIRMATREPNKPEPQEQCQICLYESAEEVLVLHPWKIIPERLAVAGKTKRPLCHNALPWNWNKIMEKKWVKEKSATKRVLTWLS